MLKWSVAKKFSVIFWCREIGWLIILHNYNQQWFIEQFHDIKRYLSFIELISIDVILNVLLIANPKHKQSP